MDETITKAKLLEELRAARAEWEALLADIPEDRMTEPGVAGEWSVKDVVAHLTSYSRWFVNASEAHFRGELPPPDGSEGTSGEERNQYYYRQAQDRPLAEVLAEFRQVSQRLIEVVEAHAEEFLIQPQHFEGAPEPILVWMLLKYDNYDHYREHAQAVRDWLRQSPSRA